MRSVKALAMWPRRKAEKLLREAHAEAARGSGMSNRTLDRLAALADPEAAVSSTSFVAALRAAGWRERRIAGALRSLTQPTSFAARVQRGARALDNLMGAPFADYLVFVAGMASVAFFSPLPILLVIAVRMAVRAAAGRWP